MASPPLLTETSGNGATRSEVDARRALDESHLVPELKLQDRPLRFESDRLFCTQHVAVGHPVSFRRATIPGWINESL